MGITNDGRVSPRNRPDRTPTVRSPTPEVANTEFIGDPCRYHRNLRYCAFACAVEAKGIRMNRRALLLGISCSSASMTLAGCVDTGRVLSVARLDRYPVPVERDAPAEPPMAVERQDLPPVGQSDAGETADVPSSSYSLIYGPIGGEPFPIPAVKLSDIDNRFLRRTVEYNSAEAVGTIVIDPAAHHLYLVLPGGRARRYGVGVGREGFGWSGTATINSKQEWPDWYPPKEMIERQPEIKRVMTQLQSGVGMPGGPRNPLGARALYLWQNNKDTLFRIHGTIEPWTVGKNVSSGCIRMINQDVIDLYGRAPIGTKVRVLA
jgi:lipoprotein-anchoring transpeptidase ErfK/SrfK